MKLKSDILLLTFMMYNPGLRKFGMFYFFEPKDPDTVFAWWSTSKRGAYVPPANWRELA